MRVVVDTILTAGDMSQASLTSSAQQTNQSVLGCIQAVFTGSPVGVLKLQVSNDQVVWTDYTGSSYSLSAAGNFAWILADVGYPFVRAVYTKTSGTGTLNITANIKGV